ncbi:MAG: hypothetical protein AAGJ55_04265 [Cyanobacteria bacterium J06555_12]
MFNTVSEHPVFGHLESAIFVNYRYCSAAAPIKRCRPVASRQLYFSCLARSKLEPYTIAQPLNH